MDDCITYDSADPCRSDIAPLGLSIVAHAQPRAAPWAVLSRRFAAKNLFALIFLVLLIVTIVNQAMAVEPRSAVTDPYPLPPGTPTADDLCRQTADDVLR